MSDRYLHGGRFNDHQKGTKDKSLGALCARTAGVESRERDSLSPRQRRVAADVDAMLLWAKAKSPTWWALQEEEGNA